MTRARSAGSSAGKPLADKRGATAVEFAILSMPLMALLFGGLDLGYQAYATSVLQGTVYAAARRATLEGASLATIENYVRDQLKGIARDGDVVIKAESFRDYGGIGKPEKITTDTAPVGSFNLGDCFIDANGNGQYNTSQARDGIGQAEDVVNYSVEVNFHRLTPMAGFLGMSNDVKVARSTVLRNEPYAGVVAPPVVCTVAP